MILFARPGRPIFQVFPLSYLELARGEVQVLPAARRRLRQMKLCVAHWLMHEPGATPGRIATGPKVKRKTHSFTGGRPGSTCALSGMRASPPGGSRRKASIGFV
jgi:hypothetical protein